MHEGLENLRGLEGLYCFVNHPARVRILCHEDIFPVRYPRATSSKESRKPSTCLNSSWVCRYFRPC